MKKFATILFCSAALSLNASAQIDTITNAGFERWGNTVPSGDTHTEPTSWYSDQSGGGFADLGPQTCSQSTIAHSGSYAVKVVTTGSTFAVVNGVVTTGIVNAPSISKVDGYIGTINHSTPSDIRRMPFNGKPDSLVGWYQYTPGAAAERGKVRAVLHIGNYFDPEVSAGTTTYHPDPTDSQVAAAIFLTDTPGTTVGTWTRFSVPFIYTTGLYASDSTPDYILINVTSSNNQLTTVTGSTMLLDDLGVVYNTVTCATVSGLTASAITATTATISWTAVSGSAGYVYAVDNSPTAPASGTFTTATSVPLSALTAGTSYYAHVYDSCGAGSSSGWVTVPFTTTSASGCAAVSNLAATGITATSATISWTAVSGSAGYVYAVNTSASAPASGTFTTATSVPATGLTEGTAYYAHVYDSCGVGSTSAWITVPFTTLSNVGVNNVAANNFSIKAFPNPVEDQLTINITGAARNGAQLALMDISGRIITTAAANASTVNISTSGLAAGIYFIRYVDAAHAQTIKITKQ